MERKRKFNDDPGYRRLLATLSAEKETKRGEGKEDGIQTESEKADVA